MVHAQTAGESIAHELRTPLTRLRATLEHAGDSLPEGDPNRDKLEVCVAEADSVLARFRALLRIAAVEATRRNAGIAGLDLSHLLGQVADRLRATEPPSRRAKPERALVLERVQVQVHPEVFHGSVRGVPPGDPG